MEMKRMDVRQESTGWRDEALSRRHRMWGFDCPATDLDLLMVEYNHGLPCAIVEYKKYGTDTGLSHPSCAAIVALADGYSGGPLPCFIAFYHAADWSFTVRPLNEAAAHHYRHCAGQRLTEQRFVRSLLLLRKNVLSAADEAALDGLSNTFATTDVTSP